VKQDQCHLIPTDPPCFVQLGRFGDIIQLLPAWKATFERTGKKPVVAVSARYASVFEGVSYAQPWVVPCEWPNGTSEARGMAELKFPWVLSPQFWNDTPRKVVGEVGRQVKVLHCHGKDWIVNVDDFPDYGSAMWKIAGFSREQMLSLPLEFDRRCPEREALLAHLIIHRTKPTILMNWQGFSSPFPHVPEFQRVLGRWQQYLHFVDIGPVKASRIYDLLGLYDRALGLITVDTATLHLAPASEMPYIAFTRSDWSGSVPKGNCVLQLGYADAHQHVSRFESVLRSWATTKP
jgi:hypothetical protein